MLSVNFTLAIAKEDEKMKEVYYEKFLSEIYDDSPYFGQARSRELDKFNSFYFDELDDKDQKILEFGSATGMLSIPLARAGYKLDSVDISPYMQDVLSKKLEKESEVTRSNINQIVADATQYKGDELYNSIVMSEGILIAIPDSKIQMELLRNCHRNLKKGGRIYTDFFQPRYDVISGDVTNEFSRFRTKDGEIYLLDISFENDSYNQIQKWNAKYTKMDRLSKSEPIEINVSFRYIFNSEIRLMLQECGFKVIKIDTDYADRRGFSVIAEKM